jgi:hypothetical protein
MDCIYTMNSVAAFIWEQLDKPMTQADLQTAMLDEYAADPEVIAADLDDFLREMTAIGAVKRS